MNLRTYAVTTIGALTLSAGLAVSPASAAVTSVTSSASVLDVNLTVPTISFAELPASGSAPPLYNETNSLPSFSTSLGPVSLTTGALIDTASGDTGTGLGSATATINNLAISLDSIFNLTSTLISSTSSVNGTPSATGSTTLSNLTITVLGTSVTIPVNPTPNDVIFKVAGLTITLNQQIPDLSESAGITTNAIALDFNKFPFGTNVVNGSVDVAQSFGSINVPEPSTWVMLLLGFAGLGYAGWRTQRKSAALAA
jgi:PEP-CTERM motif